MVKKNEKGKKEKEKKETRYGSPIDDGAVKKNTRAKTGNTGPRNHKT